MQYYVPYVKRKKHSKISIKSVIASVLIIFFAIGFICVLGVTKKKDKCFDKVSYHFVYAQKSRVEIKKTDKDVLKSLGGAGEVYFYKENYHLIANVYTKKDDASEIAGGMGDSFANSGTFTIEQKALSKKVQIKIKENINYLKYFNYIYEFFEKFEQWNMNYISGEISEGKLSSLILSEKLQLETIIKSFDNPEKDKFFDDISTYANMMILHFNKFFDEFYQSTKKKSLICNLGVNFVLTKVDLFDNLQ